MSQKMRVAAFLYRFPDKVLRAVVIYPRDGVNVRTLGLAIAWGQVADVPENVAQTRILSVADFFAICAYDLSRLVDVPALERFKVDYRQKVDAELSNARQQAESLARKISLLETEKVELAGLIEEARQAELWQHNRAENWKLAGVATMAIAPCGAILLRFFF